VEYENYFTSKKKKSGCQTRNKSRSRTLLLIKSKLFPLWKCQRCSCFPTYASVFIGVVLRSRPRTEGTGGKGESANLFCLLPKSNLNLIPTKQGHIIFGEPNQRKKQINRLRKITKREGLKAASFLLLPFCVHFAKLLN
jgi:hypothetical protein